MAQQIDRVVVLPNVGDSRLGACRSFTFDFYYSIESIRQSSPNITFITQDQFLLWNQEMKAVRAEMPTAYIVKSSMKNDIQMPKFESKLLKFKTYRRKFCLQSFDYLKYDDRQGQVLEHSIRMPSTPLEQQAKTEISQAVINALQSVKSEVMLMCYRSWILDIPHQPAPLVYADHLIERAKAAATLLYPYIAIHWRMETAMPDKLFRCSRNLVDYIHDIKAKTGIDNVYISTDYPIDGRPHSGTFSELTKEHHRAADLLENNLNLYTWARINSSLPFLNNTKLLSYGNNSDVNEQGAFAITEKLILVYANWFVSGPRKCCRFGSSYTGQVVRERAKVIKSQTNMDGNNALWNLRDWWTEIRQAH
ncbi:3765_t:CDS:1 [Paraglomus brasilianum]|uniref:3765_t:CDS:1 n=1 Tax=Paraglomus brasilianum TaxID=144538 RepID=A0A9N8ZS08_9GLOM|nr:3765_t:CDS:1 [Paraglomus brasilianum]